MFTTMPFLILLGIFLVAAAGVWFAGVQLSNTTDVLSDRLHLGQALGGLILLAIATNLPELAITVSAAVGSNLDLAIGNILGGIAVQTVVLVIVDVFGVTSAEPLTYRAASLVQVLEGVLVVGVLIVAIMGTQLPANLIADRVAPGDLLIVVLWGVGLWLLGKARTSLPWPNNGNPPNDHDRPPGKQSKQKQDKKPSTTRTVVTFAIAAIVTLIGGVALELSGEVLADRIGMSGVLFGATVLAVATSLPEISTGLASAKLGDYQLAISDIFGGNAFLPVLFLIATVISGKAVLPQAKHTDIYLAGLGILLTTVYIYGLIFRPKRRVLGMGVDSLVVLVLYVVSIGGLVAIGNN